MLGDKVQASRVAAMLVFAVVSAQTAEALELFVCSDDAERFVGEVRDDDPELDDSLRVERIELGESAAVSPPN
jgi:hypothetical protein